MLETARAAPHSGNVDKYQKALEQTIELSKLSDHEAGILLTSYVSNKIEWSMDGVPSATIAGSTPKEKLRNISNKAMIFHWHIAMVTKYMTKMLEVSDNDTQILLGLLSDSRDRLKKLSGRVEVLLQILDLNTPTTTSTKPQDVLRDDYEKKLYGWAVLNGHKEFLAMVLQEVAGFKDKSV
uniref:Ciliary neurotrophic factor n=1 Tax=Oncorhynchus kisutch TaxID=8019 RepID=A0A8C7FRJ1_ONCKI